MHSSLLPLLQHFFHFIFLALHWNVNSLKNNQTNTRSQTRSDTQSDRQTDTFVLCNLIKKHFTCVYVFLTFQFCCRKNFFISFSFGFLLRLFEIFCGIAIFCFVALSFAHRKLLFCWELLIKCFSFLSVLHFNRKVNLFSDNKKTLNNIVLMKMLLQSNRIEKNLIKIHTE